MAATCSLMQLVTPDTRLQNNAGLILHARRALSPALIAARQKRNTQVFSWQRVAVESKQSDRAASGTTILHGSATQPVQLPPPKSNSGKTLPPWTEGQQQAVRQFWGKYDLPARKVDGLVMMGTRRNLFRDPVELERRIQAMQNLLPGITVAKIATPQMLQPAPETLESNLPQLKAILNLSDKQLASVLHCTPALLRMSPEAVARRFAFWKAFLAVDSEQMTRLALRCRTLLLHEDSSVRGKLREFVDTFQSCKLGDSTLAMQLYMSNPSVVVSLSSERIEHRLRRLARDFPKSERSTWPVTTWRLMVLYGDAVVDRSLFCRQHGIRMTPSTALKMPAVTWRTRFPAFDEWQQQLEETRRREVNTQSFATGEVLNGDLPPGRTELKGSIAALPAGGLAVQPSHAQTTA
eukprot:jgi/Chlat1/6212/Chrsp44S05746